MAIYHLSVGFVSRSTGRSAVQSAAYITGSALHESRRDLQANYTKSHRDIAFTATLTPEQAPTLYRDLTVWDRLESFEDLYAHQYFKSDLTRERYLSSAQTAMTIVMALPKELSMEVSKELVEDFSKQRFVERGLIVTYALHDDEGNPHAHIQISRRSIDLEGKISFKKDRDICTKRSLMETRKLWADLTNHYLEREGFGERVTHKSFVDLGIDLHPTHHRGWYADRLAQHGYDSRIVFENQEVFEKNKALIFTNPEILLNELTHTQATFTSKDLLKKLHKRFGEDGAGIAQTFEKALSTALVVGEGMEGSLRYTSQSYKALEESVLDKAHSLSQVSYDQKLTSHHVKRILEKHYNYLSPEQKEAVFNLTKAQQLCVLVGRAGAGKTTTLKAVAQSYMEQGHHVIGMSLSALASHTLRQEAGIDSATLHSWLYRWERYQQAQEKFLSFNAILTEGLLKQLDWYQDLKAFEKSALTPHHVLLVDEAGMMGTRLWGELLEYADKSKAKVIVVGDDHQFKAIEAGDVFRELISLAEEKGTLSQITEIRRQNQEWTREASVKFADLQVQEGLEMYQDRGHIHELSGQELTSEIAKAYVQKIEEGQKGLVLAFTNKACESLNDAIRETLKEKGKMGQDVISLNGKSFALGDQVVFLENDKTRIQIRSLEGKENPQRTIHNGTRGTLVHATGSLLTIQLDAQTQALVETKTYTRLAHGYAVTTHKSQGQTVDFTLIQASKFMDAKGLYVAMTRHREEAHLFYAKEDFKTFQGLVSHLSRFEAKDLVKDYTIRDHNRVFHQRVQDYRFTNLDLSAAAREGDWKAYRELQKEQIERGQVILKDFPSHRLYLHQAGLTQETLKRTVEKFLKNQERKEGHFPAPNTVSPQVWKAPQSDIHAVKERLNHRLGELTTTLLGPPIKTTAREGFYGPKGEVQVVLSGHQKGLYKNDETGVFGDVLTFIQDQLGSTPKGAIEWARTWSGLEAAPLQEQTSLKDLLGENSLPKRVQELKLDESLGKPEKGFEKTVSQIFISLQKFQDSLKTEEISCQKRNYDQALYMALRLQKADLRSGIPDSFINQVIIESEMFAQAPQEKIEVLQERAVQKLLTLSPVGLERPDASSLQNKNTGLCEFLTGHKEMTKEVNASVHSGFQEFTKTLTHMAQTYAQKQPSLEKGDGKDLER